MSAAGGYLFQQTLGNGKVFGTCRAVQFILERIFDLLFQFSGDVISVGNVPYPCEGFGPGECAVERWQPRVNFSDDNKVFGGRYFRKSPVYLLRHLCMM